MLSFKKNKPVEPSFYPTDYPHLEEDNEKNAGGKYREYHLPEGWKPLLDSLKETELPSHPDYLMVNDLIQVFIGFFEYIREIQGGERLQKFLVNRLVHKQTIKTISDEEISTERVSQKIGKRKNTPDNIWNSEEGKNFTRQVSLILNREIEKTELRVSDILSSTQMQPSGLSHFDICQFICGMIDKKIINGNYLAEITPTNQFLIFDKETYSTLKELDRIFRADYRKFMDLEKFCRLGELEKIDVLWFDPGFGVFKNLYLTNNGEIGCRKWSIVKLIEALAWELADKLDIYYWHFSEMREALKYLFPARCGKISVRHVESRLTSSPDKFQPAGSNGYWQLTNFGDGHHTNKDAIISIFHSAADTSLHYKQVIKELGEMGRRVNEKSIYALLHRDEAFEKLGRGRFRVIK